MVFPIIKILILVFQILVIMEGDVNHQQKHPSSNANVQKTVTASTVKIVIQVISTLKAF